MEVTFQTTQQKFDNKKNLSFGIPSTYNTNASATASCFHASVSSLQFQLYTTLSNRKTFTCNSSRAFIVSYSGTEWHPSARHGQVPSFLVCLPVSGSPTPDFPSTENACHSHMSPATSVQAFLSDMTSRFFFSLFDLVFLGAGIELRGPHLIERRSTTELHSNPHS